MYSEAINKRPDRPAGYLGLGLLYAEQGRTDAAAEIFARGVEASPDNAELHYNLGLARAMAGDPGTAILRFRRALEIEPHYLKARENLAGALCGVGRFEEGITEFEKALEISPDADTHVLTARAYLALQDLEKVKSHLRKALEIDPSHAEASRMLADLSEGFLGEPRIP